MINGYCRVMDRVNWFLEWAMRAILAFMIIVVFTQVLSRFFHFSMPQLEELARYSNIYMAFLAVAYGMGKGSLVKVDALQTACKGALHTALVALADGLSLATCLLYAYSGIKLTRMGIGQQSSSMGFQLALIYIIIPIGFTFAVLNWVAYRTREWGEER